LGLFRTFTTEGIEVHRGTTERFLGFIRANLPTLKPELKSFGFFI
jgi:hypothetical protein